MAHCHQERMLLLPSRPSIVVLVYRTLARTCETHPCLRVQSGALTSQKVLSDDGSHRFRTPWKRPRHLAGAEIYPSCRDGVLFRLLRADLDWHRLYPALFTPWKWNQHDNVLVGQLRYFDLAEG